MSTWGIISAVGTSGSTNPLCFSHELWPLRSRFDDDLERPRAVSAHMVERMIAGGATKLCFVLSPGKSDIVDYFGGCVDGVDIVYALQPKPAGWCDALFRALPIIAPDERVLIGRGDSLWFPVDGFSLLPDRGLSFLLFPTKRPHSSETVVTDDAGGVLEIEVQHPQHRSSWRWGGVKMDGTTFHGLHTLWSRRSRRDESLGSLVSAYLADGAQALGICAGMAYVDVSTFEGYREALDLLSGGATGLLNHEQVQSTEPTRYDDGWRPLTARNYAAAFPRQCVGLHALHRSDR